MLLDALRAFFARYTLPDVRIAVAVSGGVDSTALLVALHELGKDIVAVHVNHHLRGAESDEDEQFVRELCARLGIELHVEDGTLDPERVKARGVEAAAREVRYERLKREHLVATAHQKNDQAETVLMRLLTGSGIAGLRGIHPVREDGFIRPLLDVTRADIEAFLRERGITPRHDRSNDDLRFLRNRVRAFLRETNAIDNLASIAEQARAQWTILERAIDDAEHVITTDSETRFESWPDDPWLRQALLHRHIQRLDPHGAREISARDLERLAKATKRVSVTKKLELAGDVLRVRADPIAPFEIELTSERGVAIPALGIAVSVCPSPRPSLHFAGRGGRTVQRFQLPAGAEPRFLVRNRRNGDRFQPLGLAQPKKLKDFLIDRKIAAELRDRLPLLIWNGEIVWVGGVEISERFKVTGGGGALYEVWIDDGDLTSAGCTP